MSTKTKNEKLDDFVAKYSKTECDTCGMKFETTKEYANHASKVSWNRKELNSLFFILVL